MTHSSVWFSAYPHLVIQRENTVEIFEVVWCDVVCLAGVQVKRKDSLDEEGRISWSG